VEEDKVQQAMATKLVEAMDPPQAKDVLLRVISGDALYEAILDDGAQAPGGKPKKASRPRKPRSDKGKLRSANPPDGPAGSPPA
jgi:hypothetical protein